MRVVFGAVRRAAVEAWRLVLRRWWVIPACLGFVPALLLSNVLYGWVAAANWSCSRVEFGASGSQYGGCSIIAGELIVAVAVSWALPLLVLLTLLYLLRRVRRSNDDRVVHPGATVEGEPAVDATALFVRAAAVLVGLANVLVIGDPRGVIGEDGPPLLGTFLLAAVAGLVASEIVLRLGRPALSGAFFARYGLTVLGMCLGGAAFGGLSIAVGVLASQPGTQDAGPEVALALYAALAYGLIAAVVGGVLGVLEGLVLGVPMAAILGRFWGPPRDRRRGFTIPGAALLCLLFVAAIMSYWAESPAPPEDASVSMRGSPPISCPEYMNEELGAFKGRGDQTTPVFETTGDWGYVYSASGPGAFTVEVLDRHGRVIPDTEDSAQDLDQGNGGGSAEFAFPGTFKLKVDQDESAAHSLLVCHSAYQDDPGYGEPVAEGSPNAPVEPPPVGR